MIESADVLRLAAFADAPGGGNPAGVVLDASKLHADAMLAIAREVGFSETAFVTRPATERAPGEIGIRYFSPEAEVPFCGHATIATAVALAEREPTGDRHRYVFETAVGPLTVDTVRSDSGTVASFTSVEPVVRPIEAEVLQLLLQLLGLQTDDLDRQLPPRVAYAGNDHPMLTIADAAVFDEFSFDPQAVRALMDEQGWPGTVTVMHRQTANLFEARNLFPVGQIVEDPATGSAAAAFGGYLRALGQAPVPGHVTVLQGRHVGRPSRLAVRIPRSGGIIVSGTALPIAEPDASATLG
ncbi:PhzF family phenazine biosynthesis protein [Pseudoclavibacter sp. CFCC 13796]|uniref:PhzF family phenazine biosynthesis protein n=1 Tax=Pseudoclavibacter sp. CFCC 13796 TaxID=2615179 RepID=UPI0017879803|nr:PhzF family phenazine biosynthesis isomerase [Pseudoclavibacter sp. CFCC 13796]